MADTRLHGKLIFHVEKLVRLLLDVLVQVGLGDLAPTLEGDLSYPEGGGVVTASREEAIGYYILQTKGNTCTCVDRRTLTWLPEP